MFTNLIILCGIIARSGLKGLIVAYQTALQTVAINQVRNQRGIVSRLSIINSLMLLGNIMLGNLSIIKKGHRIALRGKVNDSMVTGIGFVDSILPVGRGQRQLILGDRSTGKTTIFMSCILVNIGITSVGTIDGLGSKRVFMLYVGINQNLSKISGFITKIGTVWSTLFIASHSSSSAYLSYLLGLIGLSLAESFMEKGSDVGICLDDLSKHSKSYRQISLIIGKIPSRDAFPADIFNVHSALLERCGKMKVAFGSGSCTAFPVIETINSDITEFIATNVISITDGQIYMNRRLFLEGIRPSIDSALSVSRIGSAAQCKLMKLVSSGIKNRVTGLRLAASSGSSTSTDTKSLVALQSFNSILYQDHLIPVRLEFMMVLLLLNRAGFLFSNRAQVHTVAYLLSSEYLPFFYLVSICKSFLNPLLLSLFMEYTAILTSSL